MKPPSFILTVSVLIAGFLAIQNSFPATGQDTPEKNPLSPAEAEYNQMLAEQTARAKIAATVFEEQMDHHRQIGVLLKEQEELLGKTKAGTEAQLKQIERYDKVLATWERQQQQYQKYLDSLPKAK